MGEEGRAWVLVDRARARYLFVWASQMFVWARVNKQCNREFNISNIEWMGCEPGDTARRMLQPQTSVEKVCSRDGCVAVVAVVVMLW